MPRVMQESESFRIEWWAVDRPKPYPGNPRIIPESAIEKVAASIKAFGWRQPIVVDRDEVIVVGHTRRLAAIKLGLSKVPVHIAQISAQEARAYRLADNRVGEESSWDISGVSLELKELAGLNFDLQPIGFGLQELSTLLAPGSGNNRDPDECPAVEERAITHRGDLWQLGEHRLLCGSSTVPKDVQRLLAGAVPKLMVTDPPYGVNYDPTWRQKAGISSAGAAVGKVLNDDQADWREAWRLFPGNVAYVWHGGLHAAAVAESLEACKFKTRAQLVWVKTRAALSRGHYHWQHEPALYAVRDGADDGWRFGEDHELATYSVKENSSAEWKGGRKQSTVWFIEHFKSETGHSTQKPIDCMRRPILNNSAPGDLVYEPFNGSGTTLIAAEITDRKCLSIELNPHYVDVAIKRWQAFTGRDAILGSKTFQQICAERKSLSD